jgi:membrane-associated phospholipid phosphatase
MRTAGRTLVLAATAAAVAAGMTTPALASVPAPRGARPDAAADPSYPGAHATISQAATVLSAFYGDHQRLTVGSDGDPGVTRTFHSFQAAANEATLSRIFAGQHTMIDLVAGQQLGHQVADFVLHHLRSAPADAR